MARRLLDLFCGAGGAAMGYARAGFEVVGVDIRPQPHYPFSFYQADALTVLETLERGAFDVIHASPPCQEYSQSRYLRAAVHPHVQPVARLIAPLRVQLEAFGIPWVIENVEGAPLPDALELCGSMFGLPLRRHRWFACSHLLYAPGPCCHARFCINVVGGRVRGYGSLASAQTYQDAKGTIRKREASLSRTQGCQAMGIDWMTLTELSQAIPPVYTEWIGWQLREILEGLGREGEWRA